MQLYSNNFAMVSLLFTEWFKDWAHRREDEHLYHFNDKALKNFFDEMGYDCVFVSNFEDTIRKRDIKYENILGGVLRRDKKIDCEMI